MLPRWSLPLVAALLVTQLFAQQSSNNPKTYPAWPIGYPNAPAGTIPTPSEPMPQVAPIFIEDAKTSSSLVIINNSGVKAGATISVRTLSGRELVSSHRPLKPHEQQEITLKSLLSSVPEPPSTGSITVTQDPELIGMTVASQLLITSYRGALPSYVDEELAMTNIDGSATLRGVADQAVGTAILAVSSVVNWPQHVTLHCLAQDLERRSVSITLPPQATTLFTSCSGQTASSLDAYEQEIARGPSERIEAYELVTDGGSGAIAAFGLASHLRGETLVFSGIPFTDPKKINSPNSVFAGVPFGTQPTLPDGVYAPRISFANFSNSPAHVTLSIATTQPSSATAEADSGLEKRTLRQLTIPPRRTTEFTVSDASSQSGLLQSLIVESDRMPGEVLSKVVSRSDGNLYEIELLGKDQKDENNGGIHPWSVEDDSESHLLLFNYSAKPRVFGVGISNGAIVWDKKYTLAPYETREISFNELIRDKVQDGNGQILRADLQRGAVNWMVPDSGEGTGRLMVTSHSRALARNFSCGSFIVVCGSQVWAAYDIIPINYMIAAYTAEPQYCDEFSPSQCTGGSYVSNGSANYSWTVGASSVIKLNTPADQYAQSPNIYGVGLGTGSSSVVISAGSCFTGGPAPPVNTATMSCTSPVVRGTSTTCTVKGPTGAKISGWTFTDNSGNQVTSSSTSSTWPGIMVTSGTVNVKADGVALKPATIVVGPRPGFALSAVSATSEPNPFTGDGCNIGVASPPAASGEAVGEFCLNQAFTVHTATIGDGGPNNGYSYVTSVGNSATVQGVTQTRGYFYVISPDLQNSSSAFYKAQCGNYNAQTNPNGYISGTNLLADATRHESGTVKSHYENYLVAQNNSANNLGAAAEGLTGLTDFSTLADSATPILNHDAQTITTATQAEPCGTSNVSYDSSCVFQGYINFQPYQACQ
jgi:hypothetical protein